MKKQKGDCKAGTAVLLVTSRKWEHVFALLIEVIFVYSVKEETHHPWCTTHKGRVFYLLVIAILKQHRV